MRPRALWDERFLRLAQVVSTWSKDPSTRTGAVLVRPDRTVASVGYNGFPKGMPDTATNLSDRNEKYSRTVHCEINALLHCRESAAGYTLYTYPLLSCDRCFVQLAQAGITRCVAPRFDYARYPQWEEPLQKTRRYAGEMRIVVEEIPFPTVLSMPDGDARE